MPIVLAILIAGAAPAVGVAALRAGAETWVLIA